MNVRPHKTQFDEAEHEQIRIDIRAKMKGLGIAQAQIAREADVAISTLSQYLSGTYRSEPGLTETAQALSRWLRSLEAQSGLRRLQAVVPAFTAMHGSEEIADVLAFARGTGSLVMVAGAPGVSKTATSKQFQADTPRTWLATMDPTTSGVPTMLLEVLAAMGATDLKGTPQILMREVCRRASEAEGLLIIDEAQHLTVTAIEALRAINDRVGVGVAILGNEDVYSKVGATGGSAAFAQVSSRFAHRVVKLFPDPRDAETLAKAWGDANSEEITKPIVAFCQQIAAKPGGLRNVSQTFKKAIFAARSVSEPLDLGHLQGAFAQLSGGVAVR